MSNPTFAVPMSTSKWGDDGIQIIPDTTATTYYPGEMIARNATGKATHCDDTAGNQFWGINSESGDFVVTSSGPSRSYMQVRRPWRFTAKIASAAAGDEGKALYAKFSDEVAYSGVSNSILVGWVDEVISATLVRVTPNYATLANTVVAANTLTFAGTTGANTIVIPDNLADALTVKEGANPYLTFSSTNGSETIFAKKLVDVVAGINFSGATTANVMTLVDNLADALNVKEGSNSYLKFVTTNSSEAVVVGKNITFAGSALSLSATGGIGYGTGAGGAVSQASSRTTGVTVNTPTGAITLVSAAGSATPFTFTVTNSSVAALDTVIVSQKSGTDAYNAVVSQVAAGSFKVTVTDLTGTTTETPVFNFAVIKAVAS